MVLLLKEPLDLTLAREVTQENAIKDFWPEITTHNLEHGGNPGKKEHNFRPLFFIILELAPRTVGIL